MLEAQSSLKEAAEQYRTLMSELPGELPPIQALARVHARMGNDTEAVKLYLDVLKADPGNTEAILGASAALCNLQRWQEAIKVLSNISEMSAKFIDAQLLLCDIYLNRITPLTSQNVHAAAEAVNVSRGHTEDARYYLLYAEVCRAAYQLARDNKLVPTKISIAHTSTSQARELAFAAEDGYRQYLLREPHPSERELLVRRKCKVAPWRPW
ncbi:tetratricopeptide repeat protein [Ktedonosporobacter rubrisoli]|uniref:Tetratricopeptide repeat protein n=1 Tax=Ktedonosporobacter rubrisoli TaxID=2509675 RepID=A0A4P6JXQ0_KTERU|nr:tetratricopeptide repeat protein [Ktedonosporobacter rubrisoli]QBD79796.1 tetratricopeptide repeat protein [Ktedonosporobacter rubrisoli]